MDSIYLAGCKLEKENEKKCRESFARRLKCFAKRYFFELNHGDTKNTKGHEGIQVTTEGTKEYSTRHTRIVLYKDTLLHRLRQAFGGRRTFYF
jgi:hypothetical protein